MSNELPACNYRARNLGTNRRHLVFALAALGCWLLTWASGAATFTASLDRDTISLGETATLSLTFEGGSPQNVPSPPNIPNLQIAYVGPSSQFSFIDGQVSSKVTHNFTVRPQQAGDFDLPALTAQLGTDKLASQPLKLKVLKPGTPPPQAGNAGAEMAFLKLVLPKKDIYLGETVTAELQLHLRDRVQGIDRFQLTALPAQSFTVGKMVESPRRTAQIGGAAYTVVPVTFSIKPVKTGPLTLGPITAMVVIQLPSAGGRRDPFFEQFGLRGPFGGNEQRQMSLATEGETIQALPLPAENVPPTFNGAVGSYSMTMTAGPTNVTAGDPITVRVQISGRGALDAVTLPDQPEWRNFKTYPPTSKVETTDPLGLQGTKTFEQVIVPQNADIKELPPVSFSYFDSDKRSYRTLTQPAVKLVVRPGNSPAAPTVVTAAKNSQESPPSQDIVHIKPRLGALASVSPPLLQQPWFLVLQGLPVLALMATVVWRKRTDELANNPRLRRQRLVFQIIRDGLDDLRRLAAEKKSDEFFATLFHLLQEQLGERLDMPASAITEAVIEEYLRPRKVEESVLAPLHELFQACNLARYAPIKTSQELEAIIPKAEAVLRQLQELKI